MCPRVTYPPLGVFQFIYLLSWFLVLVDEEDSVGQGLDWVAVSAGVFNFILFLLNVTADVLGLVSSSTFPFVSATWSSTIKSTSFLFRRRFPDPVGFNTHDSLTKVITSGSPSTDTRELGCVDTGIPSSWLSSFLRPASKFSLIPPLSDMSTTCVIEEKILWDLWMSTASELATKTHWWPYAVQGIIRGYFL